MSSTKKDTEARPSEPESTPTSPFAPMPISNSARETNIRMDSLGKAFAEAIATTKQQQEQVDTLLEGIIRVLPRARSGRISKVDQQQGSPVKSLKKQLKTQSLPPRKRPTRIPTPPLGTGLWTGLVNMASDGSTCTSNRQADGRIDLSHDRTRLTARTAQERRVLAAWPDAVLPAEVEGFQQCRDGNIVKIPSNLRLVWADYTTLDKLNEIQKELKRALVPYNRWPMRVECELSGDFKAVSTYVRACTPDWVTFVEIILQVLVDHHVIPKLSYNP
ncbi:hypothetical protein F4774DRAFT_426853 [Daldinia eschscholtzii]|nr:hypothetical protein F4774DRAFT_426853 [Daldinia eschscholtzii]